MLLLAAVLGAGVLAASSAPVKKARRLSGLPCDASAAKTADFLVSIGVELPAERSEAVLRSLVEHRDDVYDFRLGGANVKFNEDGGVEVWQLGPPLYIVQTEDGEWEQRQATTQAPDLPPRPWVCLPSPEPMLFRF